MIPKSNHFDDESGSPPPSGGLAGVSLQLCWKCGERPATMMKYGFPVCAACAEDPDFDPEEMEVRVIDSWYDGASTTEGSNWISPHLKDRTDG